MDHDKAAPSSRCQEQVSPLLGPPIRVHGEPSTVHKGPPEVVTKEDPYTMHSGRFLFFPKVSPPGQGHVRTHHARYMASVAIGGIAPSGDILGLRCIATQASQGSYLARTIAVLPKAFSVTAKPRGGYLTVIYLGVLRVRRTPPNRGFDDFVSADFLSFVGPPAWGFGTVLRPKIGRIAQVGGIVGDFLAL